jgi:hypothetical protein
MKSKQIEIDTGIGFLNMGTEIGRKGPIITTYVNNLSVRSGSLQLGRVRANYVDTVLTACGYDPDDRDHAVFERHTEEQVGSYIETVLSRYDNLTTGGSI